ncbi:MAG: ATP-binding protein [bacterium]
MPISIQTRLVFLFTLQVVLIVLAAGFYLDWQVRETLEEELSEKLEHLAATAALHIDPDLLALISPGDEATRTYRNVQTELRALQRAASARRIYLFSQDRTSLVDTHPEVAIGSAYAFLPVTEREVAALFAGETLNSPLFKGSNGQLYKTAFAPVLSDDQVVAGLALEGSAHTLDAIQTVRRDLLILGIVVLVGSIGLAVFFSKRITIPLNRLKRAAETIAHGNYAAEVEVQAQDEVGFLGKTMEEMRRAIVARDTRQKTMLAGVAHEIRNPLGGIELFAGLLVGELEDEQARDQAQKIQSEVQKLKKIVTDFLDYARPRQASRERCPVKDVFSESQMLLAREMDGIEVKFTEGKKNTCVLADPHHLRQVFLNLLRNSLAALAGAGTITLEVETHGEFGRLKFSDSGPGIPPEMQEQIFEPFFTGRKEGTGLGLAIVKTLVEENGGFIRLVDGERAAFEIRLRRGDASQQSQMRRHRAAKEPVKR